MQRFQLLLWLCVAVPLTSQQAQCIKGDCYNEVSTYIFQSGSKYVGEFSKGKLEGNGTFYFTDGRKYKGDFHNSRFHGEGTLKYPDGRIYKGSFKEGERSGKGVLQDSKGSQYVGDWENGVLHGDVKYISSSDWIYKGRWKQGSAVSDEGDCRCKNQQFNSTFRECREYNSSEFTQETSTHSTTKEKKNYVFKDGSEWFGPLKNGLPYGEGVCEFADGRRYEGEWVKNRPQGIGALIYNDGTVRYGHWANGMLKKSLPIPDEYIKQTTSENKDDEVKVWAVIVGISDYNHLPALKYSDDDAYRMYAFYKSPEGGALPDEQIKVLIDEHASRENILNALRRSSAKADSNDVVVLYYSGHGIRENFVAQNYNGYENLISHSEIKKIFRNSNARQKLCFADACYAGSMAGVKAGVDKTVNMYYDAFSDVKRGTALLLSSRDSEISLENSGMRQGVFSHYLINGLKGNADVNSDSIVSLKELYSYIYDGVNNYTKGRQRPLLAGNYDNKMPVGVIRQ